MKNNVWQMPELSKYLRRSLVLDNGHLLVQVLKRSGILWKRIDNIAEKMLVEFAESTCPIFRVTTPLSREVSKRKGGVKLSIHSCADPGTIETIFRIIVSANQLSLYGAVENVCEDYEFHHDGPGRGSCHDRTRRPVVEGQSKALFVPSVMKTHIPLTDDPAQPEKDLLQR